MAASVGANGRTGTVRIDVGEHPRPTAIREDSPDNRIIAVAWALHTGLGDAARAGAGPTACAAPRRPLLRT